MKYLNHHFNVYLCLIVFTICSSNVLAVEHKEISKNAYESTNAGKLDEWYLMGRHGGCSEIKVLARRSSTLQSARTPYDLVEKIIAVGGNPILKYIDNVGVSISDDIHKLGILLVRPDKCSSYSVEVSSTDDRKTKKQKKIQAAKSAKILKFDDSVVLSKKGNPIGVQIEVEVTIPVLSNQYKSVIPTEIKEVYPPNMVFHSIDVGMSRVVMTLPQSLTDFSSKYELHDYYDHQVLSFTALYVPEYFDQVNLCLTKSYIFKEFEGSIPKDYQNIFKTLYEFKIQKQQIKTNNIYDKEKFYFGYLKEGIEKCDVT